MIRLSPLRVAVATAPLLCVGLGVVAPAGAAGPAFSATLALYTDSTDVHRAIVASGTPSWAVIVLTNNSTTPLRSANVSLPAGFAACPSGPASCTQTPGTDKTGFSAQFSGSTLQVRSTNTTPGIGTGQSLSVHAWVTPNSACTLAGLAWTVNARSTPNFSGGTLFNPATTSPVPFLHFTVQPPVATAYNADMSPSAQVTSLDGCGASTTTQTPPSSLTDSAGHLASGYSLDAVTGGTALDQVRFDGALVNPVDYNDTLTASATGFSSDTSREFLVAEKAVTCNSKGCPSVSLTNQHTSAVITASGVAGDVVSGSALDPDNTLCAGEAGVHDSELSSTIAVNATSTVPYTVTLTLDKALVMAITNNGAPFMAVCFSKNGTGQILSDCYKGGVTTAPPCVVSRNKNKANEVIVISVPPGDPHSNVY